MMKPQTLTVVMYHYVRPIATSRYPAIRGLEMVDFEGQLDYLQRHYQPVSAAQVIAANRGKADLPSAPVLLTFDDGYKDHFNVYRALKRRGLSGAFFPPAGVIRERQILDVNKIHFLLACVPDTSTLVSEIERAVLAEREEFSLLSTEEYREKYWQANRFDSADVIYVKRMLQVGLPERLRNRIVDALFRKFVSSDERAFADELYLSESDLKEMLVYGMEIGSHGYAHYWLNSLGVEEQAMDIDRSLDLLADLGVARKDFLFCYPYGAYNEETLRLLRQRGCGAAFTTHVALADVCTENMLEIPRLDTIDLPKSGSSEIADWTMKMISENSK
jgi:peptidoglycan/xylan/chitin deacetylase (PgdA/CDA1 family)